MSLIVKLNNYAKYITGTEEVPSELQHLYVEFRKFQINQEVYNFDFDRSVDGFFKQLNINLGVSLFNQIKIIQKFRNSRKCRLRVCYGI